jgi:hypothetical protein
VARGVRRWTHRPRPGHPPAVRSASTNSRATRGLAVEARARARAQACAAAARRRRRDGRSSWRPRRADLSAAPSRPNNPEPMTPGSSAGTSEMNSAVARDRRACAHARRP